MNEISEEIKICSALINKEFYINDLEGLFDATKKHIKEGTFKNITKIKNINPFIYTDIKNDKKLNRKAFIESILNCINYFETEKKAILSEELYSIKSSYYDNSFGQLNDPIERSCSEYFVNYAKISYKEKEVFWLSTHNKSIYNSTYSTYLSETNEHEEIKDMDDFINVYDLFVMHSFDTLREIFNYFPLMENAMMNFVIENKRAVTEKDITKILAKYIKIYKKEDENIKEIYKRIILNEDFSLVRIKNQIKG